MGCVYTFGFLVRSDTEEFGWRWTAEGSWVHGTGLRFFGKYVDAETSTLFSCTQRTQVHSKFWGLSESITELWVNSGIYR